MHIISNLPRYHCHMLVWTLGCCLRMKNLIRSILIFSHTCRKGIVKKSGHSQNSSHLSALFCLHVNIMFPGQLSPHGEELDNLPSLPSHSLTPNSQERPDLSLSVPGFNMPWKDSWSSSDQAHNLKPISRSWRDIGEGIKAVDHRYVLRGSICEYWGQFPAKLEFQCPPLQHIP